MEVIPGVMSGEGPQEGIGRQVDRDYLRQWRRLRLRNSMEACFAQ